MMLLAFLPEFNIFLFIFAKYNSESRTTYKSFIFTKKTYEDLETKYSFVQNLIPHNQVTFRVKCQIGRKEAFGGANMNI